MKKIYKLLAAFICFAFILTCFIISFNKENDVNATNYQTTSLNVNWDKDSTKYYYSMDDAYTLSYSALSSWGGEIFKSEENSNGISVRTNTSYISSTNYAMGIFIPFEVSLSNLASYGYYNDAIINFEFNYVKPTTIYTPFGDTYPSYNIMLVKLDSNTSDYTKLRFDNIYSDSSSYKWNVDMLYNSLNFEGYTSKWLIPSVKDLALNITNTLGSITNIGENKKTNIEKSVLCNYGLYIYSPKTVENALNFDLNVNLKYTTSGSYEAYNVDFDTYYPTVEDAIYYSDNSHNNINIIRSLSNYDSLEIDKDVNLYLSDSDNISLTFKDGESLTISKDANVIIKGGEIIGNTSNLISCYGNLKVLFNKIKNNNTNTSSCGLYVYEGGHLDFSGQVDGKIGIYNEGSSCCYQDNEIMYYDCRYLGSGTAIYINKGYVNLIKSVSFTSVSINVDNDAYLSAYAEGYGSELRDKYYLGDQAPIVYVTCIGKDFNNKKIVHNVEYSGYVFENHNNFILTSASFDETQVTEQLIVDPDTYGFYYKTLEGNTYDLTPLSNYDDKAIVSYNDLQVGSDFEMTITPKYGYTYPISFDAEWENGTEIHETINSASDKISIDGYDIYSDLTYSITPTVVEVEITYNMEKDIVNSNPTSFTIFDDDFTLLDVEKDDYKFIGWYTDSSFTNKITKIVTDYEVDSFGNVIGIELYPCFVKESVEEFRSIQTKSSLKFGYSNLETKEISQYFGDDANGLTSINKEVDFTPYSYQAMYAPSMHYFNVSEGYGGVDWYTGSCLTISCNDNWTIKKIVIDYKDYNSHLSEGCEVLGKYGDYSDFDRYNLGVEIDVTVLRESEDFYSKDDIIINDSNVTSLCIINRTYKAWIDEITITLEKQYEISGASIRFGVDGTNDFDETLYNSILNDYSGSDIKFGVAINKGSSFDASSAVKVDTVIDKDLLGDKTFALLVGNVTDFSQKLSACAYVCIDGVYYYAKPVTYSINSLAAKYLELYKDNLSMAKYMSVLSYLKNAIYSNLVGE